MIDNYGLSYSYKLKIRNMSYSKVVEEYVKVRAEQTENNTMIAREVKAKFNPPQELDKVRRWISFFRKKLKIKAKQQPIKRLFFDIETSYYTCRLWHIGKMDYVSPETIISQKQIICIAYKWQHEDDVHILDWTMGEKEMLKAFIEVLSEASEIIGHNIVRFDLKELRTRCIYYGLPMFPTYRTLDTLLKSREYFKSIKFYLGIVEKGTSREALKFFIENKIETWIFCTEDVIMFHPKIYFFRGKHNNRFITGSSNLTSF